MEEKVLYICTTYYHVYITLLKQFYRPILMDLVVCDDIPTGEDLAQRLRASGLFRHVWFVQESLLPEERGKNRLDWAFFQHQRRYRAIWPLLPFSIENYDDIYIFHDGTPLGTYLADAKKPYHLIEDSLNFYQRVRDTAQGRLLKAHTWKYWLRRLLNAGYFPLGESCFVQDIEVNENRNLQVHGKRIVELPRRKLQDKLSENQKKILLNIFGCPALPEYEAKSAIVLTEPLFEDGLCSSREEHIETYIQICSALQQRGLEVFVKPHPRDTADYSNLNVKLWERFFPIELLTHLAVPDFTCAATVTSSAIFSIPAKQKLFWRDGALHEDI